MRNRLSKLTKSRRILLAMLLGLFVVNAYAINLMFMSKQAPARKFSDEDWKYFDRAITHTLQNVNNGASYNWDNPASPASGMLQVLESTTVNKMPCRRVQMTNFYDQLRGVTEFVFCKQADGEWKVAQ
jgi:surface antigen